MAAVFVLITVALVVIVLVSPSITRNRGGKILAFFPLFILPIVSGVLGGGNHLDRSKETSFCLTCHTMSDHGKSLFIDDPAFLPASHFQNHRVPADRACYTCHTDYTMYGDINSKFRGLRHVYVQYFGAIPRPSELKLYTPYNNRECLQCHEGARTFEEGVSHTLDPAIIPAIKSNEMSCLSSGCHEQAHEVDALEGQKLWTPPNR